MSKRVHFASTNILYSPIPTTPSPSHSTSSLPSEELSTPPPQLDYHSAPYPRSPFPQQSEIYADASPKSMQIHYMLAYSPYSDPVVYYDVSMPPSILDNQCPSHALMEPATNPPLPNLVITSPFFPQDWTIHVEPSSTQPGATVTVGDVVNALYRRLRLAVHPSEYKKLPSHDVIHVDNAYYSRCGRITDSEERVLEQHKGVKRVDFLKGKTRFMGLSGTLRGADIWELNVS